MKIFKILLCGCFVWFIAINTNCQDISYSEVKDDYSTENYRKIIETPQYSPTLAGILGYIFPFSGYIYVDEIQRGEPVLVGQIVANAAFILGVGLAIESAFSYGEKDSDLSQWLILSGIIGANCISLWSIIDLIRVAKIKNLALQDNKLSIKLRPELFNVKLNNNSNQKAVCGLTLSLNF